MQSTLNRKLYNFKTINLQKNRFLCGKKTNTLFVCCVESVEKPAQWEQHLFCGKTQFSPQEIYSQFTRMSLSCRSSVALLWKSGKLFLLVHIIILPLPKDNAYTTPYVKLITAIYS